MGGAAMKLYHGGYNRIEHPDCLAGRDHLDFGKGFYTTLIREHAEQWAKQVSFNRGQMKPILNVYEFDKEKAIHEYRYRFFPAYDEDWMDFIVSSRSGEKPWEDYDMTLFAFICTVTWKSRQHSSACRSTSLITRYVSSIRKRQTSI